MTALWIAADWGTSNLRLWALDENGQILHEKQTHEGIANLETDKLETILLQHIKDWIAPQQKTIHVMACGMIGSRQGLFETPYQTLPCSHILKSYKAPSNQKEMQIHIVTGIAQHAPPDVMRGEETLIAGFLAQNPDFNGVMCLTGTHTKWVMLQNGGIERFHTFLTGELFALLSQKSLLRHSLGSWHDDAYQESLKNTLENPERFSQYLFTLRAANLLHDEPHGIARLSGILIGLELASMRPYLETQPAVLIGSPSHLHAYELGLAQCGIQVKSYTQDTLVLEGLKIAHSLLVLPSHET